MKDKVIPLIFKGIEVWFWHVQFPVAAIEMFSGSWSQFLFTRLVSLVVRAGAGDISAVLIFGGNYSDCVNFKQFVGFIPVPLLFLITVFLTYIDIIDHCRLLLHHVDLPRQCFLMLCVNK